MYRYLLTDNDNTLMDFTAAEHHALLTYLASWSIPNAEEAAVLYRRLNAECWAALERGEITLERLKSLRFERFLAALGRDDLDPAAVSRGYENELSKCGFLLPGAEEFLRHVKERMSIALVTNGVSRIQRGRLQNSPITPLLSAIIISEEHHISKPDPRMAELALAALGCTDKREAVFLGDSLTADIACARAAGIDSIWLAPEGKVDAGATYTVHSLQEAEKLLLEA